LKPCVKCGATDRYKDGHCRPCAHLISKKHHEAHPEKRREYAEKHHEAHPEKRREYRKNAIKNNPELYRKQDLKRKFGITLGQYDQLLINQEYTCAICKIEKCRTGRRFAVDHCHTTGKIRGLLCGLCNHMLGSSKDNIETLTEAIAYLKSSK
jgi:hypothetical protein